MQLIESLRYKLRMFGIPIEGPTNVFCDNEVVTQNAIYLFCVWHSYVHFLNADMVTVTKSMCIENPNNKYKLCRFFRTTQ